MWSDISGHFGANVHISTESYNCTPDQPVVPTNPLRDLFMARAVKVQPENVAVIITDAKRNDETPVLQQQHSVYWLLSFKTPLYLAVALLIAGIAACMVYTVLIMDSSGKSWMKSTSDSIQTQTIENLKVITLAKSTVIKLFFQKLTVQTLLGATYTTKLMAGNLALPSWNRKGGYLQSYSVDPYNTYSYPFSSTSFSGYYVNVSEAFAIEHVINPNQHL